MAYPEHIEAISTFASGYDTFTSQFQPQSQIISSSCGLMMLHCRIIVHSLVQPSSIVRHVTLPQPLYCQLLTMKCILLLPTWIRDPTRFISHGLTRFISHDPTRYISHDPTRFISHDPTCYISHDPTRFISHDLTRFISRDPTHFISHDPTHFISHDPTRFISHDPTRFILHDTTHFISRVFCSFVWQSAEKIVAIKTEHSQGPLCAI